MATLTVSCMHIFALILTHLEVLEKLLDETSTEIKIGRIVSLLELADQDVQILGAERTPLNGHDMGRFPPQFFIM